MTAPPTTSHRRSSTSRTTAALSAVAAAAAAVAPVSLTGIDVIDALERAAIAGVVTFVGSHGRRLAWVLAGLLIAIPASGASLAIALAGMAVVVAACVPKRRSRIHGAVGIALLVNAALWYPPAAAPLALLLAPVALVVLVASGMRYLRTSTRRTVKVVLAVAAAVAVAATVLLGVAVLVAYRDVRDGGEEARRALDAARAGKADLAEQALGRSSEHFDLAAQRIAGWLTAPAQLVPGLAQQRHALVVTIDQGSAIAASAEDIITTADYDRLQYDGRLDVAQAEALAAPTARADEVLTDAGAELDALLEGPLLPPLRTRIEQFDEEIAEAQRDTALAADVLAAAPGLFGADGERRYLVLLLASAELRGAGGFVGSYAELTATDGDVELTRSGGIAELNQAAAPGTRTISGPDDYLARYGAFDPQDFLQDTTLSPHFPSSASVMAELYPQSGGQPVDGVISADPSGLAALLQLTGPVAVEGMSTPLTAATAEEFLNRGLYVQYPDEDVQSDILAAATEATFDQLTSSSLPAPRTLADTLSPVVRAGHLRLWSPTTEEQQLFEELGADGSLAVPTGADGLSVVQQNTGNNKLDAYLRRTISYEPIVDGRTGELEATLRIELRNEVPSTDLPDAVVGNSRAAPIGTNVAWLTVFTPHAVTSASIDGIPLKLGPSRERDLNAWDTPLFHIPPGGQVVIEVQLAGGVDLSDGYDLRILPQPVANPDVVSASLRVRDGDGDASADDDGPGGGTLVPEGPLTVPTDVHRDLAP